MQLISQFGRWKSDEFFVAMHIRIFTPEFGTR
jgi:hypothetical protein